MARRAYVYFILFVFVLFISCCNPTCFTEIVKREGDKVLIHFPRWYGSVLVCGMAFVFFTLLNADFRDEKWDEWLDIEKDARRFAAFHALSAGGIIYCLPSCRCVEVAGALKLIADCASRPSGQSISSGISCLHSLPNYATMDLRFGKEN